MPRPDRPFGGALRAVPRGSGIAFFNNAFLKQPASDDEIAKYGVWYSVGKDNRTYAILRVPLEDGGVTTACTTVLKSKSILLRQLANRG